MGCHVSHWTEMGELREYVRVLEDAIVDLLIFDYSKPDIEACAKTIDRVRPNDLELGPSFLTRVPEDLL